MATKAKKRTAKKVKELEGAELRVAIAQDVIAQLRAKKIQAVSGTYLAVGEPLKRTVRNLAADDDINEDPHATRDIKIKSCAACAIGAVFVTVFNRCNALNPIALNHVVDGEADTSSREMLDYLQAYFDKHQLRLMEAAFEDPEYFDPEDYSDDKRSITLAQAFYYKGLEQWERAVKLKKTKDKFSKYHLTLIMDNVIRNKGTFVL